MDLSFSHLQLELGRLDVLIHRLVQRRQQAREQVEGETQLLPGYYMSEAQAYALLQRPFGYHGSLSEDAGKSHAEALKQVNGHIAAITAEAQQQNQSLKLLHLAGLFNLDRFEVEVLLICLAPALDLRYERLYGFLHDDLTRKRPTVDLILELLCPPGPQRLAKLAYFSEEADLFRHGLLQRAVGGAGDPSLLNCALAADEGVVAWLLGYYRPPAALRPYLTFVSRPAADAALLAPQQQEAVVAAAGGEAVVVFAGRDGLAQETAAHLLAATMKRPLLELDLAAAVKAGHLPLEAVGLALRDARLLAAVPVIARWDVCLEDDAPSPALLQMLCRHPGLLVVSGESAWRARQIGRGRRFHRVAFPLPDYRQRQQLLAHFLQDEAPADVAAVAGQFVLAAGQWRDVVQTARDVALQKGEALATADLFAAARSHSNSRLATLARKITPRYDWDDIILPSDQLAILHELVDTVRSRPLVLEEWGVGRKLAASAGVTVLFAGPPGTGKTMAAEVIARALELELYKIDLSSMVSKYIGETEKNLERIFTEAERSNAILFFDEADAIFGKRSEVKDAHDRYANIEVSYLLQRMEAYDGVTILATNLRANLDDAFMRRLQFAVDFPFPETADRLRIWQSLFPPDVPRDPDLDLERMARQFKLAGGNIRNIIVSAAYLAATNGRKVSMAHLMHGTRRELQKLGRLVDEEDLALE